MKLNQFRQVWLATRKRWAKAIVGTKSAEQGIFLKSVFPFNVVLEATDK